ncbi:MAG: MoaD/ThiS family protein [Nitrososphaerota archaeon]
MVKVVVHIRDPVPRILNIQNDDDVSCELNLKSNPTVADLLDELIRRYGREVKDSLQRRIKSGFWPFLVIVNYNVVAAPDTLLHDGDVVNIHLSTVTGG